jgi:hypothetical protein
MDEEQLKQFDYASIGLEDEQYTPPPEVVSIARTEAV